jgi:hypothetical protein
MGTASESTDEWIELYNASDTSVDLAGWKIEIDGDSPIALVGSIPSDGYFLIERSADTTVSDIAGDLITSFGRYGLSNSGEHLRLKDGSGAIRDEIGPGSWYAGVNPSGNAFARASMERVDASVRGDEPINWKTNSGAYTTGVDVAGNAINGTPKHSNEASQ